MNTGFRDQIRLLGFARADMLREMTVTIVENTQVLASQLRVSLQLLADLLLQPYAETHAHSSARAFGRNSARDLVRALGFTCDGNAVLEQGLLGTDEVVPILDGFSAMAIEVMTFLEDAVNFGLSEGESTPLYP